MGNLFKRKIKLKISKGSTLYSVEIKLEEKYDGTCCFEMNLLDKAILINSNDFFDCLCELKDRFPDIIVYCKGYKRNVYPSRMTRQMGKGLKAYEITLGEQATCENLVGIFDFEDQDLTSSNYEQREFYVEWLNSL